MAGSEQGGVLAGRADLFEGAVYVLTRSARSTDRGMTRLADLARRLGARPLEMDPEVHDDAVARISHLPHVAAAALARAALAGCPAEDTLRLLAAGGFRDATRIASSPPEMWRDICLTNREAILASLDDLETALGRFREALRKGSARELLEQFEQGKDARDRLVPPDGAPARP
jgi:prephenate dehydrogenase